MPPLPSLEDFCRLVAIELGVAGVAAGDRLEEDLGVSSMDLVAILAAVEDRWGLPANDADLASPTTVGELHAAIVAAASGAG